jgi:uncharacterized protein
MRLSRFNLITPIEDSDRWLIANPLSGQADVLEPEEAAPIVRGEAPPDPALVEKGYVVDPEAEERRFRRAYLDHLDLRDSDEIQLFYVPSYACNFDCSYCYQRSYETPAHEPRDEVLDAFFATIDRLFAGRKKYVTLFGGEPLLPSESSARVVERLVEGTASRGLDLAVVTNGYHLARHVERLARGRIREIQVTLDGPREVHDGRRHLTSGKPTFDAIVAGIDAALDHGMAVNLRSVVDRDNLESLVALARFAIERGWTQAPGFKTQIGRNYELHACQVRRDRLTTRLELHRAFYALAREHPELLAYHRPAFSVARALFDEGELPPPLFDACPATKTEWAFDYTGHIYSCTATVGRIGESLGTFHPELRLDEQRVQSWQERDVLAIEQCRTCTSQLACGGGCGAVAKNQTGTVMAPDCRPVRELVSLGAALYAPPEALEAPGR